MLSLNGISFRASSPRGISETRRPAMGRFSGRRTRIWLDCDPGHDDAIAIILAGYHPTSKLMGVSTVFGNQELAKVTNNACMILHNSGLKDQNVFAGQDRPLLRGLKVAAHIHGDSGLDRMDQSGGKVIGMEEAPAEVLHRMIDSKKAVLAMRDAAVATLEEDPSATLCIVTTGALTNVALFVTLFPELIPHIKVVCMGGCLGTGNIGPVVEFNFHIDPEATKIVFESGVHLTMIPLEITNLARTTKEILSRLFPPSGKNSRFKTFIQEMLMFFAKTYKDVYGFDDPPIHDPCAVLCALQPELFELDHLHVGIETCSSLSAGQSVCDVWHQSGLPPNCFVGRKMQTDKFWDAVIAAVEAADQQSPLNTFVDS